MNHHIDEVVMEVTAGNFKLDSDSTYEEFLAWIYDLRDEHRHLSIEEFRDQFPNYDAYMKQPEHYWIYIQKELQANG